MEENHVIMLDILNWAQLTVSRSPSNNIIVLHLQRVYIILLLQKKRKTTILLHPLQVSKIHLMKRQVRLQWWINLRKMNLLLMWFPLTKHIFYLRTHIIYWEKDWKTQWRIIYEVIHEISFENAYYFNSYFLKQCKHNSNVSPFILK